MQSRKKSSSSEKEKEMKTLQSAKCETAFIKEGGWENTKNTSLGKYKNTSQLNEIDLL